MAISIVAAAALVLGLAVGENLPDIDQRTNRLLHRSALTHGPLASLLLYSLTLRASATPVRWLAMGVCIGTAVHMAFDLFPRSWQGYALVSLPA